MKKLSSKKSYSWWWDSHINPKNSKWLAENLEEMDKLVTEMLKLIDEEGDSFAKKAEMYYKRRPALISHVEDFYRMYRALAERYDNVTGELRDSIASKSQRSPESGGGSEHSFGSQSPSPVRTPVHKLPKPSPSPRAAGFDVFLGSAGSSDISRNTSDTYSSSSDSESDPEEAKKENGPGELKADGQIQKIINLENEVLELKQKLFEYEEGNLSDMWKRAEDEEIDNFRSRALDMERELSDAFERLQLSEEEIIRLKEELEKKMAPTESAENKDEFLQSRVFELEKELATANDRLLVFEDEIAKLRQELEVKEQTSRVMFLGRKQELTLEQQAMLETELANYTREIENLKEVNSKTLEQWKSDISAHEEAIKELNLHIANINDTHKQDKRSLEAEIPDLMCKVEKLKASILILSNEKSALEAKVSEQQSTIEELKNAAASSTLKFSAEKSRLEKEIVDLSELHVSLSLKLHLLEDDKRQIEAEKTELGTVSAEHIEKLTKSMHCLKLDLDMLNSEKVELNAKIHTFSEELKSRDERLNNMNENLQQLHLEHVSLIEVAEKTQRINKDLLVQVKDLKAEVEKQRITISDGAEGKREAIRQLCFSLEHYRLGYQELRQVLLSHKRHRFILAS